MSGLENESDSKRRVANNLTRGGSEGGLTTN